MSFKLTPIEALNFWRKVTVESVKKDTYDLSARQTAVLMIVYLKDASHTVRGLALELNISKPAVTRALDRLSKYGLIKRKLDEKDRRSVIIQRTVKGSVFLREFGDMIVKLSKTSDQN